MSWTISKGIIHGTISAPKRQYVATWVDRAMADMTREQGILPNVWLKTGFKWFY